MENEPSSAVVNGDNTDTQSQANGQTDNVSRHSSRVGSARSGRSKAASIREAVALDEVDGRQQSATAAAQSPKPDAPTDGDRVPSPTLKFEPTPVVAAADEFQEDEVNPVDDDDDRYQAALNEIVS